MYINLLFECLFIFIRSFICFNKYQILLKLNTNILKHSVYGDGFCQGWEYDEAVVNLYRVWNMDSRGRTYAILSLAHFRFHDVAATCFGPSVSRHFSESFDHALYTQTSTSIHSLIADRAKLNPWTTAHNLFGRPFGRSLGTTLKIGRKFSDQNFGLNAVYVCLVLKIPSSKIQEKIPVPFSWYSFFFNYVLLYLKINSQRIYYFEYNAKITLHLPLLLEACEELYLLVKITNFIDVSRSRDNLTNSSDINIQIIKLVETMSSRYY